MFFVWRSEPHLHLGIQSLIFISISESSPSSFGIQSHYSFFVWRLEPRFHFGVQSRISSFGVQSHHHSQFRCSEPSSFHSFGVQSHISSFNFQNHHPFLFWRSKPPFMPSLAFRATIPFQFGIWSHYLSSSLTFRVRSFISAFGAITYLLFGTQSRVFNSTLRVIMSIFRLASRSTTTSLHFGIQSHWAYSFSHFDSFLFFSFGIQSHFSYPFMHLELFLFLVSAFRATVMFDIQCHYHLFLSFGVQSHFTYLFRHSKSPLSSLAFKATMFFQSRRSESYFSA